MTGTTDVRDLRWHVFLDTKAALYGSGARGVNLRPRLLLAAIRAGRRQGVPWRHLAVGLWDWTDLLCRPGRAVQWLGARITDLGERIAREHNPKMTDRDSAWSQGMADGIGAAISMFENPKFPPDEAGEVLRHIAEGYRS